MLSYSFQFAREVRRLVKAARPGMFYQRHGRFTVAGALLSQWMGIPLVLEYNASELWMADYWDPTRFRTWLRLCEEVSLRCASMIVVVSEPIRQELLQRGIPSNRITVSPNAVDPDHFHPGCGGKRIREQIGSDSNQTVVAFVGSFSYWHGIPVLRDAIQHILQEKSSDAMRFLLVGKGPLHEEMRSSLSHFEDKQQVVFTGIVPHDQIRTYLDAADILVSPHVPLPDGRPFFGSPTKLFEYMAMGKPIVASRLDQLAEVLTHNYTALLITPGSVEELVAAIHLLARDENLRHRLGERARAVAIERHTWQQNAARVLQLVTPSLLTHNYNKGLDVPRTGIENETISTL
jgi:glycosyltransferase involved in cell wall biosynthesis